MKRPWAFICASEGATSKHLRNYCREVYLLGYLPVCPKLQDSQYLVLEDAVERSEYTAIRQKQSRRASCIHKATTLMWKIHQQSNMAVCTAGRSPITS